MSAVGVSLWAEEEVISMAVPDFEKAIYATEAEKACVDGSAAADEILEDRRGGCSTTRIVELQAIRRARR